MGTLAPRRQTRKPPSNSRLLALLAIVCMQLHPSLDSMKKSLLLPCLVVSLPLLASPTFHTADDKAPEIRKFDQATVEKLGVAIYEQDIRAAQATDLLFAKKTTRQLEQEGVRGWIVEGDAPNMTVLFVKQGSLGLESAYAIKFSEKQKPVLEAPSGTPLTGRQRALFAARTLVAKNITRPCSQSYNVVMLPDPEKDGFLLYALASTSTAGEVLVGGHYRFTVSKDGKRIERADALSKSCLAMKVQKDMVALSVSTLLDEKPQETHVYLSLLHKMPIFVVTPNAAMWEVSQGKMQRVNMD